MNFTVYKTTNRINGKFYIGVHKTFDPNDGYLGSGFLLRAAVKKHGSNNFFKEILFTYGSKEEAYSKEQELLSELLSDPLCYNLHEGGKGGFEYINSTGLNGSSFITIEHVRQRTSSRKKNLATDPVLSAKLSKIYSRNASRIHEVVDPAIRERNRVKATEYWTGRSHTIETKNNLSIKRMGVGNSQYGICWIMKDFVSKKIQIIELESYLSLGWIKGRKMVQIPALQDGWRVAHQTNS